MKILSRRQCHLCEQMAADLAAVQQVRTVEFEIAEIDDDPVLVQRYGERVPVLVAEGQEICSVKLDRGALEDFLTRYGSPVG